MKIITLRSYAVAWLSPLMLYVSWGSRLLVTEIEFNKIFFLLRFGLVNAFNSYLKLKIRVVYVGSYNLKYLFIEFVITNLSFLHT